MSKRSKRVVSKPSRYVTTSSDEGPSQKRKRVATANSVQEDIQDIRRTLEEEDPIYFNNNNNNNNNSFLQHSSLQHTHVQLETDIQHSHIAQSNINTQSRVTAPSNTNFQSHTIAQLDTNLQSLDQRDTIVQPKTNIQHSHVVAQSNINNQSHIIAPSNTNFPSHMTAQSSTNLQSLGQRDTIGETYNRTHTHSQSYINLQPCSSSYNAHVSQVAQSPQSLTQNYDTLHAERVRYADNAFIDFQGQHGNDVEVRRDVPSQNGNVSIERGHRLTQPEQSDTRKLHERLDRIEAEIKNILRYLQDRHRAPQKPAIFPIASLPDMDIFERIDEDEYSNAVNYFRYIGGFNLREAVNICLKESWKDTIAPSFTWFGREGYRSLYNTRLIMAIYDGVCQNKHFEKPTRSEFQVQMREALRMSKERNRSRSRRKSVVDGGGRGGVRTQRDLWDDDGSNESIDEESTND